MSSTAAALDPLVAVRATRVAIVVGLVRALAAAAAAFVSAVFSLSEVLRSLCLKPAHNAIALLLQALGALNVEDLVIVINYAFAIAHADGREMANQADVGQAFADWESELF